MRTFYTGEDFYIGALNVNPFPIPHDAADPVGFAFDCQGLRCGVATDIGHINDTWMNAVSGCQALVLEANHDVEMVRRGRIPSGSSSAFEPKGAPEQRGLRPRAVRIGGAGHARRVSFSSFD